jgi:hypothetical protein
MKEAAARIKINKLLEAAGWRFFPDGKKPANIQLELNIDITESTLDALGNDFEKTSKGCQGRSKTLPLRRSKSRPVDKQEVEGFAGRMASGA